MVYLVIAYGGPNQISRQKKVSVFLLPYLSSRPALQLGGCGSCFTAGSRSSIQSSQGMTQLGMLRISP